MKFLLDMPLSPLTAQWLTERGHDAVHAFSLGLDRAPDRELLARAASEGRIVITADTDFPHLLALSGETAPGVILFRGGDYTQQETEGLLSRVLETVAEETLARSICVVDRRRIRCRPLPVG
jgi:predicted nuclease of predicted toxin-antitoxin system